jgi:hypothetical protein
MATYTYTSDYDNGAYLEAVVPTDENNDGILDFYTYYYWDGTSINDNGELINYNDEVVILSPDTSFFTRTNEDLDELLEESRIHANSVKDAATAYAWERENWHREYQFKLSSGARV